MDQYYCSWWGKYGAIKVEYAKELFMGRYIWIDSGFVHQIQSGFFLIQENTPQF